MRKISLIVLLSFFFSALANAGADGDLALSKKNQPEEVKDCFEKLNRGIYLLLIKGWTMQYLNQ